MAPHARAATERLNGIMVTVPDEDPEMLRHVPFPFPGGVFPANLGAVVQRRVVSGELPAREVIHTDDNSWAVGDLVHDPNAPGEAIATHMSHVVEHNSSVEDLASLPCGYRATRSGPDEPWTITRLEPLDP